MFNRVASITETYGATTVNSTVYSDYNANGQPGTVTVNGRATTYVYDNMGRRTSVTSPGARTVNYSYRNTGELASVNGADTYNQAYAYDDQGRMSTLTTYKDGSTPQITSCIYNNRGFMTGKNYADGNGVTYGYNADGQLTLRTWARGITTAYAYDHAGRQTGIDYSDSTPDIGYTYDWMGNPATVTDATGTHVFTYDYATAGHPGLASATVPYIFNHKVEYGYDTLGKRTSMQLLNNNSPVVNHQYTYDVQNRLASVGNGTHAAHYTRLDGSGLLSNTAVKTSGGTMLLSTDRAYDAYYRMTSIASTASSTTRSYAYTYNDKDQRTVCTLADGSYWEYAYDDKGQVTGGIKYDAGGIAIPGMSFGYDYDGIGNRNWETRGSALEQLDYTSNLINQYTIIDAPLGTTLPTYDADGNMLTNGDWTYTWNGENRLIAAESADKRLEFTYDYMGRRTEKKVYTGSVGNWTLASESKYAYDGYYQIAEFDGSDNMLKSYLRVGGEIYAVTDTNQSATYFYMTDGNKNIMALVDASGNVQADYTYDPFGRIVSKSGAYADANAFRFSSEFHDDETNLVYYNYRYYSPELGRWTKRDPIGEEDIDNLYCFISNNPISLVDEWGLWTKVGSINKGRRMLYQSKNGDTKAGLAKLVGLDEKEFDSWSKWHTSILLDDKSRRTCGFSVPNVWIDADLMRGGNAWDSLLNTFGGGLGSFVGTDLGIWGKLVIKSDTPNALESDLGKYAGDLYGFTVYAHGGPWGGIYTNTQSLMPFSSQPKLLRLVSKNGYKIAEANLMQCYSGFNGVATVTNISVRMIQHMIYTLGSYGRNIRTTKNSLSFSVNWKKEWEARALKSTTYNGVNALMIDWGGNNANYKN